MLEEQVVDSVVQVQDSIWFPASLVGRGFPDAATAVGYHLGLCRFGRGHSLEGMGYSFYLGDSNIFGGLSCTRGLAAFAGTGIFVVGLFLFL